MKVPTKLMLWFCLNRASGNRSVTVAISADQNFLFICGEKKRSTSTSENSTGVLFPGCLLTPEWSRDANCKSLPRSAAFFQHPFKHSAPIGLYVTTCKKGEHQLMLCKPNCYLLIYDLSHPQQISDSDSI